MNTPLSRYRGMLMPFTGWW